MPNDPPPPAAGLHLTTDADPSIALRRRLWDEINAFNARHVPLEVRRVALLLHDDDGHLIAGISAAMYWGWMFVDALWVAEQRRGEGIGRWLMDQAETHAAAADCHEVWLDTFQARAFYEALGYKVFAELEDYPKGQSRWMLRKRLAT